MRRIIEFFRRDQNKELLKNIKIYEQKEKIEQQKSKIHGQKQVKRKDNKTKRTRLYHN